MRKLIVSEMMTLDGVMEAPGGEPGHPHSGWVIPFASPEYLQFKLQETLDAESLLIGRVTYESFAGAWPRREGEFADKMNAMPKHVVSATLRNPDWNNTTVIGGDVAGAVARLKAEDGGPILVAGSRTLVHALMRHDLIDELRLMIFPVAVGSGHRLFPDTPDKTVLRLADARAFETGVVVNTYRRGVEGTSQDANFCLS
jgi:dihydrofolate reductase